MPQVLVKENGKKLEVLKQFVQGSETPIYGMSGGQRILLQPGSPALPTVCLGVNLQFFYDDGTPLDNVKDIVHIPERMNIGARIINPRQMAREQVEKILAARERGEKPPKPKVPSGLKNLKGKGGVRVAKPIEITGRAVLGARGGSAPEPASAPDRGE